MEDTQFHFEFEIRHSTAVNLLRSLITQASLPTLPICLEITVIGDNAGYLNTYTSSLSGKTDDLYEIFIPKATTEEIYLYPKPSEDLLAERLCAVLPNDIGNTVYGVRAYLSNPDHKTGLHVTPQIGDVLIRLFNSGWFPVCYFLIHENDNIEEKCREIVEFIKIRGEELLN